MTRTAEYCLLACIALSATAAHADFVIKTDGAKGKTQSVPQSQVAPGLVADDPHVDPDDKLPPASPKKVAVRPRLVAGFGDQVPLSFACRQIVPKIYRVSYGPGVDPKTLVSWIGGETWSLVLEGAIKPAGLHIVWSGMNFAIRN